ncbi:MAG: RNA polymerase sigma factor [Massiliimalia sp.]|jgi:RNA polymerase sigma factor (sigma-70 family)
MRDEQEVNQAIDRYADMVRRICLLHLKNEKDTEDIFQEVFLKYFLHTDPFETPEHEKAWIIRVTVNACRDLLRNFFRRTWVSLEQLGETGISAELGQSDLLEQVLSLPEKYKDPIYLHYYEGYTAAEIGAILHKKENTVYSLLSRGRALLKQKLGGDGLEESDPAGV